ncbi:MAG TPA: uracil-DNA glycosylase [Vicinamibacterales bacterium]|nr:uracil-DNA glycosylase [Vicinamibacterales bacterium]
MDTRQLTEHLRFYQELGVTGISRDARWSAREAGLKPCATPETPPPETPVAQGFSPAAPTHIFTLHEIREDIGDCTRCKLHTLGRRQIVFGAGSATADLMFVGEAPGADEDVQGVPFVGRAGQLLTKMIEAMGFSRDEVYIANVIKCRPPENRNPDPDEVATCEPFLFRQIESIQPKVIVALGAFAAKTLLRSQEPISRLRGHVYDYHGAKLIPTFHPSFLLRSPGQKKYAWEDLKQALAIMGRDVPRATGDASA